MPYRGKILRNFRNLWGWSVHTVAAKTRVVAEQWNDPIFAVDASYLTKLENGERSVLRMAAGKLAGASEVLSKGSSTIWTLCRPQRNISVLEDPLGGPNFTQYIKEGRLAETFAALLASSFPAGSVPDMTNLVALVEGKQQTPAHPFQDRIRYARAIVGKTDLCVFPMIVPGTFIIVDRKLTTIPRDIDYDSELQRPIFLIQISEGYFCCWCDRVGDTDLVKVVQHPLGALPHRRLLRPLKLKQEVHIVGTVVYSAFDRRPYLHDVMFR